MNKGIFAGLGSLTALGMIVIILLANNGVQQLLQNNSVSPPIISFDIVATPSVVDIGEVVTFKVTGFQGDITDKFIWFFHDGSNSLNVDASVMEVQHNFTLEGEYLVSVLGYKPFGGFLSMFKTLIVRVRNYAPQVSISVNTPEIWEGQTANMSVGSIADSPGDLLGMNYTWVMGDGTTANGTMVNHTYTDPGTYLIGLYAQDDQGMVGTSTETIEVKNVVPEAVLSLNYTNYSSEDQSVTIKEDQIVVFDARQSTDSPNDVSSLTFGWEFGDGTYAEGSVVSHGFYHVGEYPTTLTVRDNDGAESQVSITVNVVNDLPVWRSLNAERYTLPEGQTLIVHAAATDTPSDQPRVSYYWSLEDKIGKSVTWTTFDEQTLAIQGSISDDNGVGAPNKLLNNVTITNVPPTASLLSASMIFNLTLMITGEKWHDVEVKLLDESNATLLNGTLYREPGDPNNQSLSFINTILDLTRVWRLEALYTPEDDPVNGQPQCANPVHVNLTFYDENSTLWEFNHAFNYNKPEEYLWSQPLQPFANGFPIDLEINYYDPGQDTVTITTIHNVSQSSVIVPAPSSGPNQGTLTLTHRFDDANSTVPLVLEVEDEDGGITEVEYWLEAPLGSEAGYRLTEVAPRIVVINSENDTGLLADIAERRPQFGLNYYTAGNSTSLTNSTWITGVEDVSLTLRANVSTQNTGNVFYQWVMGDGYRVNTTSINGSSTLNYTFHTAGLYTIELTVFSGCYSTTRSLIADVLNVAPAGNIESPWGGVTQVGNAITFNASASWDTSSDEENLRFIWDFGDGDISSGFGRVVNHSYFHGSTYNVTLTVIDDNGDRDVVIYAVSVDNPDPTITIADLQIAEGQTYALEANVTDVGFEQPFLQYEWTIAGTTSPKKRLTRYYDDGTYTGYLTVTDIQGQETITDFEVQVINQLPTVIVNPQYVYGRKPTEYNITASVIDSPIDLGSLYYRVALPTAFERLPLEHNDSHYKPVRRRGNHDDLLKLFIERPQYTCLEDGKLVRKEVGSYNKEIKSPKETPPSGEKPELPDGIIGEDPSNPKPDPLEFSPMNFMELRDFYQVENGIMRFNLDLRKFDTGKQTLAIQANDTSGEGIETEQELLLVWDHDGDGVSDILEEQLGEGNSPFDDSDGDGILNMFEDINEQTKVFLGTDPDNPDTDEDGLYDGLDPTTAIGEAVLGTDPLDNDTDDDGLLDGTEVYGWEITLSKRGEGVFEKLHVYSDPLVVDSDNDGLNDSLEYNLGSNPQCNDTDDDGLTDYEEYTYGTSVTTAYSRSVSLDADFAINHSAIENEDTWSITVTVKEANPGGQPMSLLMLDREDGNQLSPVNHTIQFTNAKGEDLGAPTIGYDGVCTLTFEDHTGRITVTFPENGLYDGITKSFYPRYDARKIVRNMGLNEGEALENAKFKLFERYIKESEAFSYYSNTDVYGMTQDEKEHIWEDGIIVDIFLVGRFPFTIKRGYEVTSEVTFSSLELETKTFDTTEIEVVRHYGHFDVLSFPYVNKQYQETYTLSKSDFLTLWMGMKLRPWFVNANPSKPDEIDQFNDLARDFLTFIRKDKSYFKNDPNADKFAAKVTGLLEVATSQDFSTPQGRLEQLANALGKFVDGVINAIVNIITTTIDYIIDTVTGVVNFLFAVWDGVVGVLGTAIELIKDVVNAAVDAAKAFIESYLLNSPSAEEARQFANAVVFDRSFAEEIPLLHPLLRHDLDEIPDLGPLLSMMNMVAPIVTPLMQGTSLGDVITQFLGLPSILGVLIDLMGVNAVYFLIMEIVQQVISSAIEAFVESIPTDVIEALSDIFDIETLFDGINMDPIFEGLSAGQEPSRFSSVKGKRPRDLKDDINQVFESFLNLIISVIDGIKSIPIIGDIIRGILNVIVGIAAGIVDFLIVLINSHPLFAAIVIDRNLILSFAFEEVAKIFNYVGTLTGSYANRNPYYPSEFNNNRIYIVTELFLDFFAIVFSFIGREYALKLDEKYPDGRFGHIADYAITIICHYVGELFEDVSKLALYGFSPLGLELKLWYWRIATLTFVIGNGIRAIGSGIEFIFTVINKINRLSELSVFEIIGASLSLGIHFKVCFFSIRSLREGFSVLNTIKIKEVKQAFFGYYVGINFIFSPEFRLASKLFPSEISLGLEDTEKARIILRNWLIIDALLDFGLYCYAFYEFQCQ